MPKNRPPIIGSFLLLVLIALGHDQIRRGNRQPSVALCAHVRALEHAHAHLRHRHRQLHAATFIVLAGGHQAGIAQDIQGFFDLGAHFHPTVLESGLFFVDQAGVRRKFLRCHFQSL